MTDARDVTKATPEAILASFAATAEPTEAAQAIIGLSLLDWAACAVAGANEPVARILREVQGQGTGPATVVGGTFASPERAALINGATSHALDYDDTHFAHIGHASVAVVPAALAVAQAEGASGAAFAHAALIGCEAAVRVGLWLGRGHYQIGFHQTATAGAFGATLAAARLMGLDARQTISALGLAATRASGLKSQFGSMGKPYNAGLAAETGVVAAQLARAGMSAPVAGLSGPQGFGPTHHGAAELGAFAGIGSEWFFEDVSHKFHACCHGLHAMLEALEGQAAPGVARVEIETHPRWLTVCNIAEPNTGLEAKFSYRHTAAMRLSGIDTGAIDSFSDTVATAPDLVALRQRVTVRGAADIAETAARVTVLTGTDTTILCHDIGHKAAYIDRREKVERKAAALVGDDRAAALADAVRTGDLGAFAGLLTGTL